MVIAPITIRSTETRTFNGLGCPAEWFLEKQNPEPGKKVFFIRGNALHTAVEWYALNGWGASLNTLVDIAQTYVEEQLEEAALLDMDILETSKQKAEGLYVQADKDVTAWYNQVVAQEVKPYQYLQGTFDAEVVLEVEAPDFHLRTSADAIFHSAKRGPHVIDWKTGSKSASDLQLFVYWFAMRDMGMVTNSDVRGWFHYVAYAQPIAHPYATYPGDQFMYEYIATAEQRRLSGPYLPTPSFLCNYCLQRGGCPLYADDQEAACNNIKRSISFREEEEV